ncbi:protein of unknown function [Xenorhabdus nematophila AN6/1]|nr:hypothetical protein XNA1_4520011 [Xenorhabdus nematophila str. Anatoliense]CEF30966.1 hypothetical protein XNW1_30011 [Xenorhabdus nematophila str. Websteri]CEF33551.1 hypothetical protein XNW1_4800011 [Xenorhabdus nematophila str. Websteri]CEK21086.1 protein of unknown function [Xenorhabdus nematophila AN6/1]
MAMAPKIGGYRSVQSRPKGDLLVSECLSVPVVGQRHRYLASLLCGIFPDPVDSDCLTGSLAGRDWPDPDNYRPYLRGVLGQGFGTGDGGRLGHTRLGEETPSTLVS